ncbi:MAG: hypothetical protein HYX71_01735 [Opitutae bacterium]|nr:hypothetical protein [Opitutae bacterium]
MSDFAKNFLNEDWKAMPDAPRFYLCGFGKHPGWNDHLDDIGVITDSLIRAKVSIYGGIAHQVESAVWERGGPDKMTTGFDHVIHWRRMNESLTGLMWSSSDGKGRSLYPMITLAHCVGQAFDWQATEVLPVLEDVGKKCRATKSSVSVVEYLNAAQESLRARLAGQPRSPVIGSNVGVKDWAAFCSRAPEGLRRVLHHLRVNFAAFAPGSAAWRDTKKQARAQSRGLRLPVIPGSSPAESLNVWLSFLATQLDPAVPMLGLRPVNHSWLDVIVGEPTETDFVVLRTRPAATAVVSEIPYEIGANLSAEEAKIMAALGRGELPDVSALNGATVEANRQAASKWLAKSRLNFFSRFLRSTGSPF